MVVAINIIWALSCEVNPIFAYVIQSLFTKWKCRVIRAAKSKTIGIRGACYFAMEYIEIFTNK